MAEGRQAGQVCPLRLSVSVVAKSTHSLYIIESGILKASNWRIGKTDRYMSESMMPATVAGALSSLF